MIYRFMYEVSDSGCWDFKGALMSNGYGRCCGTSAHREMWRQVNGAIPKGMLVLHKCDNRKCVNPDHLFLGTYQDNHNDMWRKGRANPCIDNLKLSPFRRGK